jgi:hypothetical protein
MYVEFRGRSWDRECGVRESGGGRGDGVFCGLGLHWLWREVF